MASKSGSSLLGIKIQTTFDTKTGLKDLKNTLKNISQNQIVKIKLNFDNKKLNQLVTTLSQVNKLTNQITQRQGSQNQVQAPMSRYEMGLVNLINKYKTLKITSDQFLQSMDRMKNATPLNVQLFDALPIQRQIQAINLMQKAEREVTNNLAQAQKIRQAIITQQQKQVANEAKTNAELQERLQLFKQEQTIRATAINNKYGKIGNTSQEIKDYLNTLNAITVKNGQLVNSNTGTTTSFRQLSSQLNRIAGNARNAVGFFDKLRDSAVKFAQYFFVGGIIVTSINTIKNGINIINEFNKALTDIKLVTGQTAYEINQLGITYNNLAKDIGATTKQVIEGATEWYRQGKTNAEVQELVAASIIQSKLAAIDSAQSTEYLTSVLNGFKMETSDVMTVIDKMVAIDNAAATSVAELAEAMKRSANSASQAGVTFDELLAYIGTISSVTRKSAETIGESMKTLMSRLADIKIGDYLEDGIGVAEIEEVLNRVGVKLRENEYEFRAMGQVIADLASKWNTLSEVDQAAVAKVIAGTRQRENFLVLMNNFNKVLEMQQVAAESAGLALDRYNNIYLESTEAKINQLKANLEGLWMETIDSGFIQGIIDGTIAIVKLIDKLGGLTNIVITILGLVTIFKAQNIATSIGSIVSSVGTMTSELGKFLGVLRLVVTGNMTLSGAINNLNISTSALAVGGFGVLTLAISGVMMAISAYNKHQQELIEKSEKAIETFRSLSKEINNNISILESFVDEYEVLSKGVDKNGKNISLTAEQYERYKEIVNQIVEINPDLIQGYNDENLAIIEKTANLKEMIAYEKERLQLAKQQATVDFEEGFKARLSGINETKIKADKLRSQLKEINKEINEDVQYFLLNFPSIQSDSVLVDALTNIDKDNIKDKITKLQNYLNVETNSGKQKDIQNTINLLTIASAKFDEYYSKNEEKIRSTTRKIATLDKEYNMEINKLISETQKFVAVDIESEINELPEKMQDVARKLIDAINFEMITNNKNNSISSLSVNILQAIDLISQYSHEFDMVVTSQEQAIKMSQRLQEISEKTGYSTEEVTFMMKIYQGVLKDVVQEQENVLDIGEETVKTLDGLKEAFSDVKDSIKKLNEMQKELDENHRLSMDSVNEIVQNYQELLPYINDEATLREKLTKKLEEARDKQVDIYLDMLVQTEDYYETLKDLIDENLMQDEKYYKEKVINNAEVLNDLIKQYEKYFNEVDGGAKQALKNFKNLEETKKEIVKEVVSSIAGEWAKYYDATSETFDYNKFLIENPAVPDEAKRQILAQMNKAKEEANKAVEKLNKLAIDKNKIDLGLIDDKSKSKQKYADYVKEGLNETIQAIKSKGEYLTNEISLLRDKIIIAETEGNLENKTIYLDQLTQKYDERIEVLKQQRKELEKLLSSEIKEIKAKGISGFSDIDLESLDEKKLSDITRKYQIQIEQTEITDNDKLKADLKNTLDYIQEHGEALLSIKKVKFELDQQELKNLQESLQHQIDKIEFNFNVKAKDIEESNQLIELQLINVDEGTDEWINLIKQQYENMVAERKNAEKAIEKLRRLGYSDESEIVQKYKNLWYDAEKDIVNMRKNMFEKAIELRQSEFDRLKNYKEKVIEMLRDEHERWKKQQEEKVNSLKQEQSSKKDALNLQKEILKKQKEEYDYQRKMLDIRKSIADIVGELSTFSYDDSSEGIQRRIELQKQLEEKQQEYKDASYEYFIKQQEQYIDKVIDALDKVYEAQIAAIEKQIDKEVDFSKQADAMIQFDPEGTYKKLLEWNREYGTSIDADIINVWLEAKDVLEKYDVSQQGVLTTLNEIANKMIEIRENAQTLQLFDGGDGVLFPNTLFNNIDQNNLITNNQIPTVHQTGFLNEILPKLQPNNTHINLDNKNELHITGILDQNMVLTIKRMFDQWWSQNMTQLEQRYIGNKNFAS